MWVADVTLCNWCFIFGVDLLKFSLRITEVHEIDVILSVGVDCEDCISGR